MAVSGASGATRAMGALAVVWSLGAALGLGAHLASVALAAELRSRSPLLHPLEVLRLLSLLSRAPGWVDLASALASALAAVLLARFLRPRPARALAALAGLFALASAGSSLFELVSGAPPLPRPDEMPPPSLALRRALWVAEAALARNASALVLAAGLLALPEASAPRGRHALYALYVAASLGHVALVSERAQGHGLFDPLLPLAAEGSGAFAALVAALSARGLARSFGHEAGRGGQGALFFVLGAAGSARVLFGLLGAALAVVAARAGDQAALRSHLALSAVLGAAAALAALAALARLAARARPSDPGRRALAFACIFLALSTALDLFAASAALELSELAERAARANPLWRAEGLSRLASLQATSTWAGRLSLALGAAAACLATFAMRRQALTLGREAAEGLAALASRLACLFVALAAAALALGIATDALHAPRAALLGGAALAGLSLGALYGLLRLTLSLDALGLPRR